MRYSFPRQLSTWEVMASIICQLSRHDPIRVPEKRHFRFSPSFTYFVENYLNLETITGFSIPSTFILYPPPDL
jgi:hypothetical protein